METTKIEPGKVLTGEQRRNLIRWVHALEGRLPIRYQQTKDRLRGDNGFCCLGVACDLLCAKDWASYPRDPDDDGEDGWRIHGESATLPEDVTQLLGLPDSDPQLEGVALRDGTSSAYGECLPALFKKGDTVRLAASSWNDEQGATFKEIAAMIRHTYQLGDE